MYSIDKKRSTNGQNLVAPGVEIIWILRDIFKFWEKKDRLTGLSPVAKYDGEPFYNYV